MDRRLLVFILVCCAFEMVVGSTTANSQSLLIDLGPGTAHGINNSGQVVLSSGIWTSGTVTAFPTGFTGAAINAGGVVAGGLTGVNITLSCAIDTNGTITNLGVLSGDQDVDTCNATGINTSGQVVGWSETKGGVFIEGIIDTNGVMTGLQGIHGPYSQLLSEAFGINDGGQVTGFTTNNATTISYDAFIYDNASMVFTDLGPGTGYAINASGEVTGVLPIGPEIFPFNPLVGHAVIYANGSATDLGALTGGTNSVGYAINTTGEVVGASDVAGNSITHAFFYNGGLTDLNALVSTTDPLQPFVTLTDARGINDSRLIVANGIDSRTQLQHAYLLQGPSLDVTPGPLSFPSQAIGTVSSAQSVSLSNSGSVPLGLGTISTAGDFKQTNSCGASLAASGSCTVMVTFTPTAAGNRTGFLTIISAGVPITLPLAGVAPIQINISSGAATTTAAVPVKLTWTVSPGATCTATGGSAADGWTGTVALSGTQSVTESTAGTYSYGLSCTAGTQSQSNQTSVVVIWPVVSVSLTALPASFTAGQSITLNWNSANATSCTAAGGGAGDTWPGPKSTSGSIMVTEPYAPATPSLTLTFTLTCTSSASGQSANASAMSVENAAVSPPANSGGGALDSLAVLFLTSVAALRGLRKDAMKVSSS